MLSAAETQAHIEILDDIERGAGRYCGPSLAVFRPRCPGCRHVLGVSVWVDCMRVFRCNWCDVTWRECL